MRTGTSLEWQVFEEREWDAAVAAGLLGEDKTGDQPATMGTDPRGWRWLRLAELASVALVGFLLGMAYPSWQAAGMG